MLEYADDRGKSRWLARGGGLAAAIALSIVGYHIWHVLSAGQVSTRQVVQRVSIVRPPPPATPREPPPEEPQPEELPKNEELPQPEAKPVPEPDQQGSPSGDQSLALDADASPGSDAFGLAGRNRLGGSIGRSANGYAWYGHVLERDLEALLANAKDIRSSAYSVTVKLWIAFDGRVERTEIVDGTGNALLDTALQKALEGNLRISELPPQEMPQPVRLRLNSRF